MNLYLDIVLYLRKNKKRNLDVSLDESLSFDKDGNELTQKEVAKVLGISQSYISRIEKRVIKDISNLIKI